MGIAGTAGLSLGVMHEGEVLYYDNFGYADVESEVSVDEETIFPGCSLIKAVVSATIGSLVEDGTIGWDTLVKDILPNFDIKSDIIQNSATITDLLAHRTGMSISDHYLGSDNNVWISKDDSMKFLNDQQLIKPFRGQWQYNNLGYELVGHVLDKVTGRNWAESVRNLILSPLKLHRTFTDPAPEDEKNVAKAYCTLDNGAATQIHTVRSGDSVFGGSSGGLRSCVSDLLKLYGAFMEAINDQFETGATSTDGSPFKQASHLVAAKIPMDHPTIGETSYALGWVRVQLPGMMGAVGCNPPLMPQGMPIVGKGAPSRLVVYHQGSLPGALSSVMLIPETRSSIVVMTNSLSLNDCPDWVGQLVLEEMLEVPHTKRNDYLKAARVSADKTLAWYASVSAELKVNQTGDTSHRPLVEYQGEYWNTSGIFKIVISLHIDSLVWAAQGLESERYLLTPYENDSFTWLQPRDEMARRGRWVDQGAEFWKLHFHPDEHGRIVSLSWAHDKDIPNGEIFLRKD